jgi:hypothetical protein
MMGAILRFRLSPCQRRRKRGRASGGGENRVMENPIVEALRQHAVWWMLLLFVGVLVWGFRGRLRARREDARRRKTGGGN